jgi:urate oxidase
MDFMLDQQLKTELKVGILNQKSEKAIQSLHKINFDIEDSVKNFERMAIYIKKIKKHSRAKDREQKSRNKSKVSDQKSGETPSTIKDIKYFKVINK